MPVIHSDLIELSRILAPIGHIKVLVIFLLLVGNNRKMSEQMIIYELTTQFLPIVGMRAAGS